MNKLKLLFSIIILYQSTSAQSWQVSTLSPMPEPITNNAICEGFIDDTTFVYSFAGMDSTKLSSGIHLRSYRYNTNTDEWMQLADLPDASGKIAAGASRIGSTIYIIGGYHVLANGNEISSNRTHRFDITTNSFLDDAANIPIAIDDQVQCVWRDSLIYVISGWSNTGNVNAVQIYDAVSNNWQDGQSVPNNNTFKCFGASGTIVGDTIYYFGGASMGANFPAQNSMRKGIIDPLNPTQIAWSSSVPDPTMKAYRAACTDVDEFAVWIGGSDITYNYNGIAYNGSGGVSPVNRTIWNYTPTSAYAIDLANNLPMDLRGVANASNHTKYIAGGMNANQQVTDALLRLDFDSSTAIENSKRTAFNITIFPNPATTIIHVAGASNQSTFEIEIMNVFGQVLNRFFNEISIDVSKFPSGNYLLKYTDRNGIAVKRLTIR